MHRNLMRAGDVHEEDGFFPSEEEERSSLPFKLFLRRKAEEDALVDLEVAGHS